MGEVVKLLQWLAAIAPALEGLYRLTQGDSKKALQALKVAYQQADKVQSAQMAAKKGPAKVQP